MRITVLAIGTRMPAWVDEGVQDYLKRLPKHIDMSFKALPAAQRSSRISTDKLKEKEGEQILKALPEKAYTIALDEHGKQHTSSGWGKQLENWLAERSEVCFLIGGADGLADICRSRADEIWSLSDMTLPHALVRVVLAEQVYRAWTLTQGHPYHRD
ncbi:MAG: 23S rRNA (pseudouridine(1915)-N(3))-methyltransferase RlmH [Gammaproteobacteria bacterium]